MNIKLNFELYVRSGKSFKEMEKYRNQGLVLLHEGLLFALETGCKPHSKKEFWIESINKLEESCLCFLKAATPGLKGGFSSNIRLALIALLEATSLRIDAGISNYCFENTQFAIREFKAINEPIGVIAAEIIQSINKRGQNLNLPFDIGPLLLICSETIKIQKTHSLIEHLANDISKIDLDAHAFPERDILLLTLLHKSLPFHNWRYIFEEFQREKVPHFETEIASILITFIIAVATAVSSNVISEVIKNSIHDRRELKKDIRSSVKESQVEEKLNYLLKGYTLREFHLKHPEILKLESFNDIWLNVRNNQPIPDVYQEIIKNYSEFLNQLSPELRSDAEMILDKIVDLIIDDNINKNKSAQDEQTGTSY